jgi:ubiquinone/menaquinone biosynthesis C-methylase UbiE
LGGTYTEEHWVSRGRKLSSPEYISYRRSESEVSGVLSRVRFPESRSTINLAKRELFKKPNSTVLEIGCGPGVSNMYLSYRISAKTMVGLDLDRGAVRQGHLTAKFLKIENLNFIVASATHLPLNNAEFDFVLCQEVIEHVPKPEEVLAESFRVLKNEGKILITTPTSRIAPLSSDWFEFRILGYHTMDEFAGHLYRFSPQLFADSMADAGFGIVELRFTNQYLGAFFLFATALWKRKKLRTAKGGSMQKKPSHANSSGVVNLIFMLGQTIDFRVLGNCKMGSNIVILANAKATTH